MKITVFDRITASKPKFFIGIDEYREITTTFVKDTGKWRPAHELGEGVHALVPGLLGVYDGMLVVMKPGHQTDKF